MGTTSANGKLTVASGATTFVAGLTSTGTNTYTPTASTSLVNSTLQLSGGNASGATTGIRMSQSSSFELFFGGVQESGGAGAFVFQGYSGSAYAERARIDSSGNLGLGTTSPAQRLDVAGTIRLTPNTADLNYSADIFASYDSAHPFQINVKNNATTAEYMGVYADGGGANNRVVFPTGNVGIGTTSPAAKLHIAVPDASVDGTKGVKITNAAGTTVVLECGVSSDSFVGTTSGSLFNIRTQNVVRATFDTSGNFLVGTTSGSSAAGPRIYVDNTNNVSGDSGIFALLGSNCSNTSSAAFSALITGVGNKFYVYGNGNVVNTNNSYGAISDVKFKENIVDATPKLDDVLNLKVRNFNLKTEPNNKQIGFIAQEFEEVFPSMIDVSPDTDATGKALETTHKSIKLSVLVPILVKAIQEQQTIIESLKARLDAANL